jgi:hypothetical protein
MRTESGTSRESDVKQIVSNETVSIIADTLHQSSSPCLKNGKQF